MVRGREQDLMAALQAGCLAWATPGKPLPCLCSHRHDAGSWVWRKEGSREQDWPISEADQGHQWSVREHWGPRGDSVLGEGPESRGQAQDAWGSIQFSPLITPMRPRSLWRHSGSFLMQGLGHRCPSEMWVARVLPGAVVTGVRCVLRVRFAHSLLCAGTRSTARRPAHAADT